VAVAVEMNGLASVNLATFSWKTFAEIGKNPAVMLFERTMMSVRPSVLGIRRTSRGGRTRSGPRLNHDGIVLVAYLANAGQISSSGRLMPPSPCMFPDDSCGLAVDGALQRLESLYRTW